MESFENNPMEEVPVNEPQEEQATAPVQPEEPCTDVPPQPEQPYAQPQYQQPYRNAGAGRKESPFADSPYVMKHNPGTYQNAYQTGYQPNYQSAGYNPPPAQPKKAPKVKKPVGKIWKRIGAAVLALAVLAAGCGITAYSVNHYWHERTRAMQERLEGQIADLEKQIAAIDNGGTYYVDSEGNVTMSPAQVYSQNVGAVVAISNHSTVTNIYGQVSQTASSGSGFVISEDGYVVTNYHVVQGATSLTVILSDSTEYDATLVGGDETNDIAVLKIEAEGLQYVTIGSSEELTVGDQVVAIGNPLGELTSTLTAGYVSAKDRDVSTSGAAINMIQTDAAINSGNSGGPLFNMKGEVVGITTAKYSGTSASGATIEGIGFAIPMDDVVGMIEDLSELGYITGAYLGVMVRDMDATAASTYGLPMGAYVQEVTKGYCAEEAGLQAKDIIVNVGGYDVESINDLSRALRKFKGGDTTTITVFRSGGELTLPITLDDKPAAAASAEPSAESQTPTEDPYSDFYGFFYPFFGEGGE